MAKQAYYEDTGKYFSGMDGCWAILKHAIKWQDITPSGRKGKILKHLKFQTGCHFFFPLKKVKFQALMRIQLETLNKTVSDNQARRIQLEERRVASLERQTVCEERETVRREREMEMKDREMEERIMQMDLFVMQDPQMKAYYEHRKAAILAK
ncbi:hypothetical protein Vadar_001123 [Vaccinium darrowii]|uniref:Uncharacterized protein n=1 Tax=Vaccinium darrowii TaxID=229202 RepID=A0ACB7Z2T4_9ERIC|nr:hypothetical protein Vadar_001123 [Vaccinium darrowii]